MQAMQRRETGQEFIITRAGLTSIIIAFIIAGRSAAACGAIIAPA
jgi:hypothetical protein